MATSGDETWSGEISLPGKPPRSGPMAAGDRVGFYVLRRLLGEGGMGRVYLARDSRLGRSVALKLVSSERIGLADTRRVIAEAQITARFSHPHIVQIYDVGEHSGAPYLALEYLEGESLRERAARDRLSLDEVLRIARAVAEALAHAHASGICHRDLKPSNVMIPRDGRVRVVDFGLALSENRAPDPGIAGTPDWMAPEQWLGTEQTDRIDVWALAVMVHELLSGEHPFGPKRDAHTRRTAVLDLTLAPRALDAPVHAGVIELVQRSLARSPRARPTASEWVRVLDEVLAGRATGDIGDAPYRGLAAFDEQHANVFFGRDPDIDAFLEQLRQVPLLPIVGPSGTGKSSFLHAGVLPRMRLREPCVVLGLRPGSDPFRMLASRLLESSGVPSAAHLAETADELRATPTLLALRLSTLAASHRAKVVLAIDQLEELFTQGASELDAQRFLDMLARTSDDPCDPVRIIVTLRDDFIGRMVGLRDVFVLRPLGAVELRCAITAPLARTVYRFESPSLVDDMMQELGEDGGLPLLQFACRALWDARDIARQLLTHSAYRDMGGVAGALAGHADRFIAGLTPQHQGLARQLVLRLAAGATTRRVVARAALLGDLPRDAEQVLDRLLSARLVVQRRIEGEPDLLTELAHESLLNSWKQLERWLMESGEQRRLLDELAEATSLWEKRGKRPDEPTWSAEEIASARRRALLMGLVLPAAIERFLAAGELRHSRARRRARRRIALGLALATGVTVVSLLLAHTFREQRIAAELANGNLGQIQLVLAPFDWRGNREVAVPAKELPTLSWRLHTVAPDDVHAPGVELPTDLVRSRVVQVDSAYVAAVEAPGGAAFLRIEGRGRAGEACAPSWIRLQALPGYASRGEAPRRIELPVPTCQASAAGTVEVPAGDVIYGGAGVPATRHAEYVEEERTVHVPHFAMDITETSNAAFGPFTRISSITGYATPRYPQTPLHAHAGDPDMPVAGLDAFQAEAFCRFMGKRLPGDYQWTKAARGGVMIGGRPNPMPRRLYPWGATPDRQCVNGEGDLDGYAWTAPVHSLPCGASPYGILHLGGNVAEWVSREGQAAGRTSLRIVRGGMLASPWELEHATTVFRNQREDRQFDYGLGVRCVDGPGLQAQ